MGNWSELPTDIIGVFAERLVHVEDFVRFGCVSKSWRWAAIQVRNKPFGPWLMLSKLENDGTLNEGSVRSCFSLSSCSSTNRAFNLGLPELQGRRCWGTEYGWIITLGLDSQLHLFNPLTRARFSLPPRTTFPGQGEEQGYNYENDQHMCCGFPGNFALASDPSSSGDSVLVMAIYGGYRQLAFASPKHQSWTRLTDAITFKDEDEIPPNDDVIFFKDRFYSISLDGTLRMCDVSTANPTVVDIASPPPQLDSSCAGIKLYLSEISSELHLIVRHWDLGPDENEDCHPQTYCFNLYKFDFHNTRWIEVKGFKSHSLFVGNNTSFAISASDYPDFMLKPNCIYFTDDEIEYYDMNLCDVGVFDMETRTLIEPFYEEVAMLSKFSRSFVFVPSLV